MANLVERLDAELRATADPTRRGELEARKAAYLARSGAFDASEQAISRLRQTFGSGESTRVTIWIMLAEGLLHTFREMSAYGTDRIMRAQVLATASREPSLIAITSAWRAHTQSERSEFVGMSRSLATALVSAKPDDHEAKARVFMTLANAYSSLGDRERSQRYYQRCRFHAIECGDQATTEALIYNRAAFALGWLRAQKCFGNEDSEALRFLGMEIASARTYQKLANLSALSNFADLWEARLNLLTEKFELAAIGLQAVRDQEPFADYNFHESLVDLEIGYCHDRMGRRQEARHLLEQTAEFDPSGLHLDDQLVAAWVRNELSADTERPSRAIELQRLREDYLRGNEELRSALSQLKDLLEQEPMSGGGAH